MTKHYVVIHTNKNLNVSAFKVYIACFNICFIKEILHQKMVSDIMGHPVYVLLLVVSNIFFSSVVKPGQSATSLRAPPAY